MTSENPRAPKIWIFLYRVYLTERTLDVALALDF